jgi:hypothetical protein
MSGAPAYKLWKARLQELSSYVQCYPAPERRGSSPLVRETGVAAAPGGGAANAAVRRAAAGLAWPAPPNLRARRPGQQCLLWRGGGHP